MDGKGHVADGLQTARRCELQEWLARAVAIAEHCRDIFSARVSWDRETALAKLVLNASRLGVAEIPRRYKTNRGFIWIIEP